MFPLGQIPNEWTGRPEDLPKKSHMEVNSVYVV
jgi:hypothetical protein